MPQPCLSYRDHSSAELSVRMDLLDQERTRQLENDCRNQEHGRRV